MHFEVCKVRRIRHIVRNRDDMHPRARRRAKVYPCLPPVTYASYDRQLTSPHKLLTLPLQITRDFTTVLDVTRRMT